VTKSEIPDIVFGITVNEIDDRGEDTIAIGNHVDDADTL
jgi:hypothetical protein